MQTEIKAIPTEYNGHRFRSRLEARWACFFDNVGWPWEYEALDLEGYIPDFILTLPHAHVLVEVKPVLYEKNFMAHWRRIKESGWRNEALLVGAKIFDGDRGAVIGSLMDREYGTGEWGSDAPAVLQTCERCNCVSFFHDENWWGCRSCGQYKGNEDNNPWKYDEARSLFADWPRRF